jgi:hypothetical protein
MSLSKGWLLYVLAIVRFGLFNDKERKGCPINF